MKYYKVIPFLVLSITFMSKILGFIREISIANVFGVNQSTDIFFTILLLPLLVSQIVGSNLSTKLIGELNKNMNKENVVSQFIFNSRIIFMFVTIFICIVNFITLFEILKSESFVFVVLSNICLSVATYFWGMSYVHMGILNSNYKFIATSLAPVISNLINIILIYLFHNSIIIMPIAFLLSAIIQYCYVLLSSKNSMDFSKSSSNKIDFEIIKNLFSMVAVSFIIQVPTIIERFLLISLGAGYVTLINLGSKIFQLPTNIIISSVVTILFPNILSLIWNKNYTGSMKNIVKLLTITVPITSFFVLFGNTVIIVLFSKSVDNSQIHLLNELVYLFSFSIALFILRDLIMKIIFSFDLTRIAIFLAVVTTLINVFLDVILIRFIGIQIVPMALCVNLFSYCGLLVYIFRDKLLLIDWKNINFLPLLFNLFSVPVIIFFSNKSNINLAIMIFLFSLIVSINSFFSINKKIKGS